MSKVTDSFFGKSEEKHLFSCNRQDDEQLCLLLQ